MSVRRSSRVFEGGVRWWREHWQLKWQSERWRSYWSCGWWGWGWGCLMERWDEMAEADFFWWLMFVRRECHTVKTRVLPSTHNIYTKTDLWRHLTRRSSRWPPLSVCSFRKQQNWIMMINCSGGEPWVPSAGGDTCKMDPCPHHSLLSVLQVERRSEIQTSSDGLKLFVSLIKH